MINALIQSEDQTAIVIEGTTRLSNIAQRYDNGKQYPELLISNYDTTELARSSVQLTLFDEINMQEILNERIIYNGTISAQRKWLPTP